jgi:hypothetical protein
MALHARFHENIDSNVLQSVLLVFSLGSCMAHDVNFLGRTKIALLPEHTVPDFA